MRTQRTDSAERLGDFRVVEQIGTGRLGPVFRAFDDVNNRVVAVKVFTMDLAAAGARRVLEEFERLIARDLAHPTIVKPLATGISSGRVYLAQEYVGADSIDRMLSERAAVPTGDAMRIAAELAGAIDFAAVANVHHGSLHLRDVFPVGLTRATGFGVAQALERSGVAVPLRTRHAVTHQRGDSRIDHHADIVALASVVHLLLFGSPLGVSPVTVDVDDRRGSSQAIALRRIFDRVHARKDAGFATALEFVAAVMAALGFETSSRVASVDDLELALERPISADDAHLQGAPTFVHLQTRTMPQRMRSAMWAGTLAALIGTATFAAAEYRHHRERAATPDAAAQAPAAARATPRAAADAGAQRQTRALAATPPVLAASAGLAHARTQRTDTSAVKTSTGENSSGSRSASAATPTGARPAASGAADDVSAGMLFVDSHPRGASLFLDEKFIGTTPLAVSATASGEHALRLESDGYRVWSSPVHVAANRLNRVMVSLDR